jgi:hypothetical protein
MGADFSRVRLNPLLDYAGVELQQGRVLLDADMNELVGVFDRRLRAMGSDVLGRARVSSTTPDAFKISVAGGTLQIGKGRLYVDGLLAENHGAKSDDPAMHVFDDLLAESQFADAIAYTAQPYMPVPPPALPTAGRHLVYLDVWDREVTHLENSDLIENAVGVDATSRIQTVWQVRVLEGDVGATTTCETPDANIPGWSALIAPSTGVLTTGTFDVAPTDNPCELPPTGGYRGLENQLYRVEIHDPGQPGGTATFKWSRENASFGSRVASIVSATELELQSLGRDDVLRFKNNDWVEIIDDNREFSFPPKAGEIRRSVVDEATRRIQFTPALPAAMLPAAFPDSILPTKRNLRVRRWDQSRKIFRTDPSGTPVEVQDLDAAGSTGLIKVPSAGTTLILENGVTVGFASTGTTGFRTGDYWVFAARTADASVEHLDRAPPRGIHHHYARLGIWDVAAGTVTNCRNPWPPAAGHDCSCIACVSAEDHNSGKFTIQTAIDQAKSTGGRICLGPGLFQLSESIRIVGALALELVGHGQTVLLAPQGNVNAPVPAILVDKSAFVTLTGFGLVMAPGNRLVLADRTVVISTPGIMIENSASVTVERCQFYSFGNLLPQNPAVGLGGFVLQTRVCRNSFGFFMPDAQNNQVIGFGTGVGHLPTIADKPNPLLLTLDLYVEDNFMQCGSSGIHLDALCYHAWQVGISGNFIGPSAITGIAVAGIGVPAPLSRIEITGNEIVVTSSVAGIGGAAGVTSGTGIVSGVSAARISNNDILPLGPASGNGILLDAPLLPMLVDGCQILGNRVGGVAGIGIEIRTPLGSALIKQNTVQNAASGGIVMTGSTRGPSSAQHLSIANNQLLGLVPSAPNALVGQLGFALGIRLDFVARAEIEDNVIRDLGMNVTNTVPPVGIALVACAAARIAGNQITNIGPLNVPFTSSAGIAVTAPFERAEVSNNVIRRSDPIAQGTSDWRALYVGPLAGFAGGFKHNLVPTAQGQFVVVGDFRLVAVPVGTQLAAVRGNVMTGSSAGSFAPTGSFVELTIAGSCVFTDNQAVFQPTGGRPLATLAAPLIAAGNNILTGGLPSLQIQAPPGARFTVLGNVASGTIVVNGALLAAPWEPLNMHG